MLRYEYNYIRDIIRYLLEPDTIISRHWGYGNQWWYVLFAYNFDEMYYKDATHKYLLPQKQIESYDVEGAFKLLETMVYITELADEDNEYLENTYSSNHKVNKEGREVLRVMLNSVKLEDWDNINTWSDLGIDKVYVDHNDMKISGVIPKQQILICTHRSNSEYFVNPNAK